MDVNSVAAKGRVFLFPRSKTWIFGTINSMPHMLSAPDESSPFGVGKKGCHSNSK